LALQRKLSLHRSIDTRGMVASPSLFQPLDGLILSHNMAGGSLTILRKIINLSFMTD
jgi:hypothetical protein